MDPDPSRCAHAPVALSPMFMNLIKYRATASRTSRT